MVFLSRSAMRATGYAARYSILRPRDQERRRDRLAPADLRQEPSFLVDRPSPRPSYARGFPRVRSSVRGRGAKPSNSRKRPSRETEISTRYYADVECGRRAVAAEGRCCPRHLVAIHPGRGRATRRIARGGCKTVAARGVRPYSRVTDNAQKAVSSLSSETYANPRRP